jgi:multidrug efflux pump subunit AcrB
MIDGITKFNIEGDVEKEVHIKVDMKELNQHGISIEDVYKIVKIQNLEIPSGDIEKDGIKVKVSTPGIYTSCDSSR